jgi:hypothetical protein
VDGHAAGHASPPPAFAWEDWYASVGGRSIRIAAADDLLRRIYDDQYPRFHGDVARERRRFESPEQAAQHLKQKIFPTVPMLESPPPTDLPASHACHTYPRIDRP